ncbi:c-type cytochrome [Microbulbifer agarilyticus]|uniref:c-type cytochrome n=1 Tax=Microbulbifer agarilyticus TaxID=260552 RepID=UPI001CD6FE87|nr:cytochrome c [Microbulbifer agarilyticus]MCA0900565.1 cytochrome c [Microbulbifer agarilyticus]
MIIRNTLLLVAIVSLSIATGSQAQPLPGYQSYNGFTNDVGPDLATVIEYDATKAACDQYQSDLDQYLIDNDAILSQLSDVEVSMAVLSEHEQYIVDNFVNVYDEETLLKCGKYQYFYETFDTTGPPKSMMHFMLRNFEDYFGPGFENYGMYEDPNPVAAIPPSPYNPEIGSKQMPVGIASSSGDFGSSVPVYAFTCAACHFSKMDDGNFAVGIGNTRYDYAKMIAAQGQLPYTFLFQAPNLVGATDEVGQALLNAYVIPEVQQELSEPVAAARATPGAVDEWFALDAEMNAGSTDEDRASIASTLDQQRQGWATWSGVMDFLVPPMQDDGQFTITRILNLPNVVSDVNVQKQHGFNYQAGLGWHGGSFDLINFVRSFITLTPSDIENPGSRAEYNYWVNEYRYMPIVRYIESFDEPSLPLDRTFDLAAAKRGEAIFDHHCASCHNGPGGETSRPYDHAEIDVEDGHANIMDLFWDDTLFGGIGGWETNIDPIRDRFPAGETGIYTRQVKAPRFISMWDNERLLHNGSVRGLDELFTCVDGRVSDATQPDTQFSNQGHEFGCYFAPTDKSDLKAFIETFATSRNVGNRYNGQWDGACNTLNNGKSQIVNLTFTKGKRMDLLVKYYSDANCQVFDTDRVKNPGHGLSWEMAVGSSFVNSRGYLSHNVTYTKPDGTIAEDVIAIEGDQLANAEEGDPEPRGLFIRERTDYAGLNGLWLNDECTVENTRELVAIRDGVRVNKTVAYNAPGCTGGVLSMVNDSAWTFEDPKWLNAGVRGTTFPMHNMRLKMTNVSDGSKWTQFINVTETTLHAMFNNYFAASINGNGEHYTRVYNINTAE